MPTRTFASAYRHRHAAIGRKGEYEASMLWDADENEDTQLTAPLLKLKEQPTEPLSKPSSPMTIASTLDMMSIAGEVQPLVLPGAWVVVGRKGKALKNDKMYEEPEASQKKKKKKKARGRKVTAEAVELVVALEEAPSTSKCLEALGRSTAQAQKQLSRSMDAKHWARYNRAKEEKRGALDELVAVLGLVDLLDEDKDADVAEMRVPAARVAATTKDNKANRLKDKARRRARSAAEAALCFLDGVDDDAPAHEADAVEGIKGDLHMAEAALAPAKPRRPRAELSEVTLPGAWLTVGQRGKALPHFPPLSNKPADKVSDTHHTPAKRAAPAESSPPHKTSDKRSKGKGMVEKCSVM